MVVRDVLVHVKSYEEWSEHIEVAGRICKAEGARLSGLYTLRNLATLKAAFGPQSPGVVQRQTDDYATAAKVDGVFRAFLERAEVVGEFRIGEGAASELITWASRFHDLVVVEQTDHETDEIGWDVAEECALGSGRPTLIVPFRGEFPSIGRRIVVAWNGSRQAARALHGALPFIERAEKVAVLKGKSSEVLSSITRYPDIDVAVYLQRYTSRLEVREFDCGDRNAGAAILDAARHAGADLLVMGAYGRSWFSEWMLGGATRTVLRDMHLPVLMAH